PTTFGHHRRTHDDALMAPLPQVPKNPEATRPCLIHEMQPAVRRVQRAHDFVQRLKVAGNHAVVAHVSVAPTLGDRHVDRFFVDIEPDEHATVSHDLPPRMWLGAKRQTLRIIHDVTRGRSTLVCGGRSQRHWTIYSPPSRPPAIAGPAQAAVD